MKQALMVCCPGEWIRDQTTGSLLGLLYLLQSTWSVHLYVGGTVGIYASRNSLLGLPVNGVEVCPFQNIPYDYILWVDNDMVFTPDDFHALLKHDKDIVSGLYRNIPFTYCAAKTKAWDRDDYDFLDDDNIRDQKLIEVSWAGFGFMLVKNGVFESLGYPWFKQSIIKNQGFDEAGAEDESFGYRLQHETDYKIYVDPAVKLKHLKIEG